MAVDVFSVPVFFVVLRETLEAAIIVAVLLAFLKQTLDGPNKDKAAYRYLVKQVWLGSALGFLLCLIIGGAVIGTFYRLGKNVWGTAEYYYEGAFYLVASLIISVVGAALLRIGKLQEKWRVKIAAALHSPVDTAHQKGYWKRVTSKYVLFLLAFFTVSREGIEGVIFISGVSFSAPAQSVPLPVVVGLITGCIIGWLLYRGGSIARLQVFLIISTCVLYLVAAGLFVRAIWYFEQAHWNTLVGKDVAELGDGPGSYDIDRSVWHVNCCSPDFNGGYGWGVFNGILGWTNSATYSTVIAYNVYWLVIMATFITMRYQEVHGHWPFLNLSKSSVGKARTASRGVLESAPEDNAAQIQMTVMAKTA